MDSNKPFLEVREYVAVGDSELADLLLQKACHLLEGEGVIIFSKRHHLMANKNDRILFDGDFISEKTYPYEALLIRAAWALLEPKTRG